MATMSIDRTQRAIAFDRIFAVLSSVLCRSGFLPRTVSCRFIDRRFAYCLAALLWLVFPCSADPLPRSILVLEQSDVRGPFSSTVFSALRAKVNAYKEPVSIYVENLDLSRFGGSEYEQGLRDLFHIKYRDKPIGVIVAVGAGALDYANRWRSELWPGVPVVFAFVDEAVYKNLDLPADVTGKTTRASFQDMVAAARAVVPGLRQVALLGDPLGAQSAFKHLAKELPAIEAEVDVLDLTGVPMVELQKRVAALPDKTAIIYTAIYSDGAGTYFPPADGVAMIAAVANRPIIAPVETYIPRGAVGGYVTIPSVVGEEAAAQALEVMEGRKPSEMPIAPGTSLRPVFDWPGLRRWGVDEANLPPNSEIRNRELSFWAQYPFEASVIAAVVVMQSGMIAALLYEHRRRRRAEIEVRARMRELAHLNRQATAGELSASIAHELNQPLGAMLAHAETSEILLGAPSPDIKLVKEVVGDIKRENQRASEVIVRLRRLLKQAEVEMEVVDLNQTVADVFKFVAVQASDVDIELKTDLSATPLFVRGDPIQLQQVVLNLVINSIDAIRDSDSGLRRITGRTTRLGDAKAMISIADTGPGIPAASLERVLEPFYSTKDHGMGMGLSIARTIIESHGGSIRAENREDGGCVFRIELPLQAPQGSQGVE